MEVLRLDHVQLAMPAGLEADAVAFYEGVLGIPHVPKPTQLAARGGCWFERGSLKGHLGVDGNFQPATKAHPPSSSTTCAGWRPLSRRRALRVTPAEIRRRLREYRECGVNTLRVGPMGDTDDERLPCLGELLDLARDVNDESDAAVSTP